MKEKDQSCINENRFLLYLTFGISERVINALCEYDPAFANELPVNAFLKAAIFTLPSPHRNLHQGALLKSSLILTQRIHRCLISTNTLTTFTHTYTNMLKNKRPMFTFGLYTR